MSLKNLKSGSAWIVLIIGLFCYFIGFKDDPELNFSKIAIKIGDVFVIGVIIGFLANAARFIGVFKGDLQDIVNGTDFLNNRKDIVLYWKNTSKALINNKFESIHEDFLNAIIGYFPIETPYFIKDYDINTTVKWIDKYSGIVNVIDTIAFDIITESEDECCFPIYSWTVVKEKQEYRSEIKDVFLDDQPISIDSSLVRKDSYNGQLTENHIILKGKKKYPIRYIREKQYNINVDYYIGFRAKCIVDSLRVSLVLPDDIEALFISRGVLKYFKDIDELSGIQKRYKGIILPGQGYIFALKQK